VVCPSHAWRRRRPAGGARDFWSPSQTVPLDEGKIKEILLSHPAVDSCICVNGIAYVGRASGAPTSTSLLDDTVEDWELEEYLMVKALKAGGSREEVPHVRSLHSFPGETVPFGFVHILDAVFGEIDKDHSGKLCFKEFANFCHARNLFSAEGELEDIFLKIRSLPSASEILFSGGTDMFRIGNFQNDRNIIRFYQFQKLISDAGLVEITTGRDRRGYHAPKASYFVDDRLVDIVLRHWFAAYDGSKRGLFGFEDYVRLVEDYSLPFATTEEAFKRLDTEGAGGLDKDSFFLFLEEANIIETGASVEKADAVGQIWREIKEDQHFLHPTRVFVADGRAGTSPPKRESAVRFVCVSDTHGRHSELTSKLPEGDVLLHGGDFTMNGELQEVVDFAEWLQSLPYAKKIVIAGNHDLSFDGSYSGDRGEVGVDRRSVREAFDKVCGGRCDGSAPSGVVYLEDQEYTWRGIRIYGTPWQPEFGYWAFNLPRGDPLLQKWRAVPEGIDVLIVHGPPLGRGDRCEPNKKHVGCADLLSEVQGRIRPQFVVCGHVHEGASVSYDGTTHYLNSCSLNEHYECVHAPLVFDLDIRLGR